jgi:ribonuclease Y
MIEHTLEETLIGISLAHEFGADSNIVRLGCLFHDIGKVIYDDEATHVETGVAYLQKFNLPKEVIDCVAQSHEDEPFSSIESIIVHIADSISGARPAARHNDHEFVNRVKYLEETPKQYKGVKDAYAIQAGREVRVVVDPKQVTDEEIVELAQTLRDRIKNELTYPGSVTVNVIRELQHTTTVNKSET